MIGILLGRPRTISQAILLHNNARAAVIRVVGYSNAPWSLLLYPAAWLFRLLEKRAMKALIQLEPQDPQEAREKLLHLMALLTANAAPLPPRDVQRAIDTLRPFSSGLAGTLGQGLQARRCTTSETAYQTLESSGGRRIDGPDTECEPSKLRDPSAINAG